MAGGRAGPPGQEEHRGSDSENNSYHVDSYSEEPAPRGYDVDGVSRPSPPALIASIGPHHSAEALPPDCNG